MQAHCVYNIKQSVQRPQSVQEAVVMQSELQLPVHVWPAIKVVTVCLVCTVLCPL